jgi:hypothetical protein
MFWIETVAVRDPGGAADRPGRLVGRQRFFVAAMMMALAGILYRIDAYLVAYNTGAGWRYFPSMGELSRHHRPHRPRDSGCSSSRSACCRCYPGWVAAAHRCRRRLTSKETRDHGTSASSSIPITRIEGHLRIDCEVDGGKVTDAWASGTMWRGVEQILLGRDPRDAWAITQRFCGVCTTVHAIASVRAVENALQHGGAQERPVHPQPDDRRPRDPRRDRPLLPPVGARLGRRHVGAQGRSQGDRRPGREPVAVAAQRRRRSRPRPRSGSPPWSAAASSASSPTATGATRR